MDWKVHTWDSFAEIWPWCDQNRVWPFNAQFLITLRYCYVNVSEVKSQQRLLQNVYPICLHWCTTTSEWVSPPHVADGRMSALDSWEKHCPPSNLDLHDMIASKHANISGSTKKSTKNHHAKYMHHSCQYTCINEGKPIPSQHSWDINHETSNHFYLLWIQLHGNHCTVNADDRAH